MSQLSRSQRKLFLTVGESHCDFNLRNYASDDLAVQAAVSTAIDRKIGRVMLCGSSTTASSALVYNFMNQVNANGDSLQIEAESRGSVIIKDATTAGSGLGFIFRSAADTNSGRRTSVKFENIEIDGNYRADVGITSHNCDWIEVHRCKIGKMRPNGNWALNIASLDSPDYAIKARNSVVTECEFYRAGTNQDLIAQSHGERGTYRDNWLHDPYVGSNSFFSTHVSGGNFTLDNNKFTEDTTTAAGSGTVAITNGSAIVTGTGTTFIQDFEMGDMITIAGFDSRTIASIQSNTQLTVTTPNNGNGAYASTLSSLSYLIGGSSLVPGMFLSLVGIGFKAVHNHVIGISGNAAVVGGTDGELISNYFENKVTFRDDTTMRWKIIGNTIRVPIGVSGIAADGVDNIISSNTIKPIDDSVGMNDGINMAATSSHCTISDNTVRNANSSGNANSAYAISGTLHTIIGNKAIDDRATKLTRNGLRLSNATNCLVEANKSINCGTSGGFGILSDGTAANNSFFNNIVSGAGGSSASNYSFVGTGNKFIDGNATTTTIAFNNHLINLAEGIVLMNASSAPLTVVLPDATTVIEREITIKKNDSSANVVTIATSASQTINGASTTTLSSQYESITVVSNGSNWLTKSKSGTAVTTSGSMIDNDFYIVDNGDATKRLKFESSVITTGTTRTLTAPDVDGSIAAYGDLQMRNGIQRVGHNDINVLSNASMEWWFNGTSVAPVGWTLGSSTCARSSTASSNTYSAQLTFNALNDSFYQAFQCNTNTWMTFTIFYQKLSGSGTTQLVAEENGADFTVYASATLDNTIDGTFRFTMVSFQKPNDGTNSVRFKLVQTSATGTDTVWLFDEAKAQEGKNLATAFTYNPVDDSVSQGVYGAKTFFPGAYLDLGNQVWDVKAFGAKGDATTDDSAAIQAAFDAADVNGGVVYFPIGTFIAQGLIWKKKVSILGASRSWSILKLKNSATSPTLIESEDFATAAGSGDSWAGISYVTIENMTIDGNQVNQSTPSAVGDWRDNNALIKVYGYHIVWRDLEIINAKEISLYTEHDYSWDGENFNEYQFGESVYENIFIKNYDLVGWVNRGSHDSHLKSVYISSYNDGGTNAIYGYIQQLNTTDKYGAQGAVVDNLHVWGEHSQNAIYLENCGIVQGKVYAEGSTNAAIKLVNSDKNNFQAIVGYAADGIELDTNSNDNKLDVWIESNIAGGAFKLDGNSAGNELKHITGSGASALFDLSSYTGGNNVFTTGRLFEGTLFDGTPAASDRIDAINDDATEADRETRWELPVADTKFKITSAGVNTGTLSVKTAGLNVTEGSNARMGVAILVAGTITVSTTVVAANSRIQITIQSLGTVATPKAIGITARTAATSFTITSADNTDTSVVAWLIIDP